MAETRWRIVILSTVPPAAAGIDAIARASGHEPVAVIAPRLAEDASDERRELFHALVEAAPGHLDLCLVPSKDRIAPLLRR